MPNQKPRSAKAKKAAMQRVMGEFKTGDLRSGSKTGPRVKKPKQAIAIGLSESGQARKPGAKKRLSNVSF
jgi:hypothetical protein